MIERAEDGLKNSKLEISTFPMSHVPKDRPWLYKLSSKIHFRQQQTLQRSSIHVNKQIFMAENSPIYFFKYNMKEVIRNLTFLLQTHLNRILLIIIIKRKYNSIFMGSCTTKCLNTKIIKEI